MAVAETRSFDAAAKVLNITASAVSLRVLGYCPACQPHSFQKKIALHLRVVDQSETHKLLQQGQVNACISNPNEAM
ncbi:LysR family transcriptional regulator [Acinetobacter bohemicus]|uniref:LysR family transcriptional regulator n=1 Tax=Acinetobacter TaxID=469 RepID=UPI00397AFB51